MASLIFAHRPVPLCASFPGDLPSEIFRGMDNDLAVPPIWFVAAVFQWGALVALGGTDSIGAVVGESSLSANRDDKQVSGGARNRYHVTGQIGARADAN